MKTNNQLLTFGLVSTSIVSTYFLTTSTAQQGVQTQTVTVDNEYQSLKDAEKRANAPELP